ncbi:MAG: hypothetical protein NT031_12990, partial [Planctomycetota bacterium]|nr:hypothetical protein [Planctomycetota bacterium]
MSSTFVMTQDPVVRTLLAAMARGGAGVGGAVGQAVADYDWDSPCSFGLTESASLDELTAALAGGVSQGLSALVQGQAVNLASAGFREYYASQLAQAAGQAGVYGVEVTDERDRVVGTIELSPSGVRYLMATLLGGAVTEESGAIELTPVEADLLLEAVDVVTAALAPSVKAGVPGLRSRRKLLCPPPMPADEPTREYGRLAFKLDPSRATPELTVTLQGSILLAACGAAGKQAAAKPAEETRKWLRQFADGGMVT